MTIPYLACMASAAVFYHLPPRVLPSIQAVEGGRPGLVHINQDGSRDLGVMQVNTRWVRPLAWQTRMPPAEARQRLLLDPCFNIAVAGAIMRIYLNEAEGNLLRAVGYYHSHSAPLANAYRLRVVASAARLFGGDGQR
ncbi:MAG TPA: lytic transglycosylase domain-containing protein [Acetobacteraceae bacterium]|nr:lytic transglycosylase domain-containing protein [Acetobacteraceae bacterium]